MSYFKSTSSILWLGREKEKKILELCKNHIERVICVVKEMHKTFHAFGELNQEKVEENFKEVFRCEREADEIKRNILEELSKGLFHPINREEIIRLLLTADDIASYAKAASRKLLFIPPKSLTKSLREVLMVFSDNLLKIAEEVNSAFQLLIKDPRQAVQASHKVENLEEKIDDFRVESIIPEFLSWCDTSKSISLCLILKEIIDGMENLADKCEDVADVIRGIAISYV
ncbi:hypothetical protein DRO26_04650 [Candidatus Bathyarchaeota archaeon]|nr:MAG: hypothetical protein DRO26_04650 [Candidatus Bathyarchaeota archaeon]